MALTPRQREVFDYIAVFIKENGYSPSFEEIGDALGMNSLATVHKHVSNLEAKGCIVRDYNRSRSIDVVSKFVKLFPHCKTCTCGFEVKQ